MGTFVQRLHQNMKVVFVFIISLLAASCAASLQEKKKNDENGRLRIRENMGDYLLYGGYGNWEDSKSEKSKLGDSMGDHGGHYYGDHYYGDYGDLKDSRSEESKLGDSK